MSYSNNNNNNNRGGYQRSESTASNRSGGGGGRRPSRRTSVDVSSMPLEQGIICSLKDSFGFIHCAERPEEIFFHYSEVSDCYPDQLQVDTEVEFRVGQSDKDSTKKVAYAVKTLEPGTVEWETEEEPGQVFVGLVEKNLRNDARGSGSGGNGNNNKDAARNQEGSIQLLIGHPADGTFDDTAKKGLLVRFRQEDIASDSKSRNNRLFRGDLVKFRVFLDRRTKQKYARQISVVLSEKERTREERERKILESATEEEGMVISLNNGYGFLKTNKRRHHVYFHYSHLILPEDQDGFELKKGQEMKFLVVTEVIDGQTKCSARKLQCLPKGSVQFHTVIARGVKGVVTVCPQPPSAGNNPGYADDKDGSIRLIDPLSDRDADGNEISITDVSFEFNDAPGGVYTFQQRGTTSSGLWILNGDTLLFDVVKELADGSYQAAPTNHTLGIGGIVEEPSEERANDASAASIRLVACSLVSRAEGTMHTLKLQGGYGFIHFAERPIDVHFHTYNVMPEELQSDLRKQLGYSGEEVKIDVGVGAQFDICAHGTVHSASRGGADSRNKRGSPHERENIKAHRILILPPSAVQVDRVLVKSRKGVVKTSDAKQLYAGFVDLDETIEPMAFEERHPLVAKMIDDFLQESSKPHGRKQLVYRDVLSARDDEVVVEMVKLKGAGVLSLDHIPVAGGDPRSGRLCIKRIVDVQEAPSSVENENKSDSKKKQPSAELHKNLRFDKSSLIESLKDELPPNAGDVIVCDVVQSRRTGKITVENLKIIERSKETPDLAALNASTTNESAGVGVVQNVVPKSNFGFISVLDEKATRQELIFFSLSSDKGGSKARFRKGDEVKFSIGIDPKTGKRMAKNVEILPKGTIPSKPSQNACRGIILMEPTNTRLSDTPLRKAESSDSSGGRWANVKDNAQKVAADIHTKGVILLLEDKTGMFCKQRPLKGRKRSGSVDSTDGLDDQSTDGNSTDNDCTDDERSVDSGDNSDGNEGVSVLDHLSYKNGAIAIFGAGAGGGMDTSSNPRRGDIVTFVKAKRGTKVRDIRTELRQAVTMVRGRLEEIKLQENSEVRKNAGTAKFIAATEKAESYDVDLSELVSCDASLLKDQQQVEGILHDGRIYGICRTCDLYLESKLGTSHKERPKLNLAVKKDRGGRIMAQSHMAKGPDGTHGFVAGWTTRTSQYAN